MIKRKEVRDRNPHLTAPTISKMVSKKWKRLTKIQKKPFDTLSNRDYKDYHKLKKIWEDNLLKLDYTRCRGDPLVKLNMCRHFEDSSVNSG